MSEEGQQNSSVVRTYVVWLNGNARRTATTQAADEFEAAEVFRPTMVGYELPAGWRIWVWVRLEFTDKAVCVELDHSGSRFMLEGVRTQ